MSSATSPMRSWRSAVALIDATVCALTGLLGRGRQPTSLGRAAEMKAPTIDTAHRHHSAVCMLEMKGESCSVEMWLASPENTLNSTCLGTAEVMTASTKAIEMTAPVFCTSTRAPAAMPRRCGATVPIMAAVLGELNMPEPIPTMNMKMPGQT